MQTTRSSGDFRRILETREPVFTQLLRGANTEMGEMFTAAFLSASLILVGLAAGFLLLKMQKRAEG